MDTKAKKDMLLKLRKDALLGGGTGRIEAQHAKGKMTARERIDALVDSGSFRELDAFVTHRTHDFEMDKKYYLGDSVVTGWATVEGRPVYLFSQDFTVLGGSLGEVHAEKICKVMDLAVKNGVPVVGLNDSGGARIQEGVVSLGAYADIFLRNTLASGVVPQISAILGPCAGGAVYSPALTDFIFMVKKTSHMFITGPDVVKTVTHEDVSMDDLGGAAVHASKSGVAHFSAADEADALAGIRQLLGYLPANNMEDAPRVDTGDDPARREEALNTLVPDDPRKAYDMHEVIGHVVDNGEFLEVHAGYAGNILVGFGRLDGLRIAIVGDIRNSRVVRSNLWLLTKMGAQVTLVAPPTLLPPGLRETWPGITLSNDLDATLPSQDAVMMLRCQFERGTGAFIPGQGEYARFFQLNAARMRTCRPDVAVLHPGPINRGVEITSEVADGPNSLVLQQVTNGVPVRMAVLFLLCNPHGEQVP